MTAFLGIDLGAGSLKATVIDGGGRTLAEAAAPVTTVRPQPGWAEQDPADWASAMQAALAVLGRATDLAHIDGIGFSAGTHTTVLMDRAGAVVRPAILWSDQRAAAEAAALNASMQDRLIAIAYNRAAPTWSISHLDWLRRNDPEAVRRTSRIQFAKDWLRARLTGDALTDRIDAQGSLLLDGASFEWSAELCRAIEWNPATLPRVCEPTDSAGTVTASAARQFGLRAGTPVYVGSADTAAEAWAASAIETGDAVIKLATAGVVSVMVDRPYLEPDIAYKSYIVPGHGYVLAATNSCASAHKWLRDLLLGPEAGSAGFAQLDEAAAAVPAGSGGLMFHPYLQGERAPYWDPGLRGDFLGMTMAHTRGHFVRALYEGIALSLRDAASRFRDAGLTLRQASLIGGGARSDTWTAIIADVFGIPVRKPVSGDASFAAALIAAVGAGQFDDPRDAVRRCVRFLDPVTPDPERSGIYDRLFDRYRRAKVLLTPINHEISAG